MFIGGNPNRYKVSSDLWRSSERFSEARRPAVKKRELQLMLGYIKKIWLWPPGFKLLYLLIIFDGSATYYGLSLGVIREVNPVMAAAFDFNPLLTLILKLVLSVFFLDYICTAIRVNHIRWPLKVMPFLIAIHAVVAALHLYWIGIQYSVFRIQ